MDHIETIKKNLASKVPRRDIVRKVYLTMPTSAFHDNYDIQYDILNSISKYFSVPITSVHVAGSAKVGRSIHKNRDFTPGESDLDIAIIDSGLFTKWMEISFEASRSYINYYNNEDRNKFLFYISKGIFNYKVMPRCSARGEIETFFHQLTVKHEQIFRTISAFVYLSQTFFEVKQLSVIKNIAGGVTP